MGRRELGLHLSCPVSVQNAIHTISLDTSRKVVGPNSQVLKVKIIVSFAFFGDYANIGFSEKIGYTVLENQCLRINGCHGNHLGIKMAGIIFIVFSYLNMRVFQLKA